MKLKLISALVAGLISAAPAFAENITLDFEGAGPYNFINAFYNGGTNDAGASGVNYGISFAGAAYALSNDPAAPIYSNAPTAGTIMSTSDADGAMTVASGFSGIVSFYYSSAAAATVNVWSGANGTGSVLASFSLNANAQNNCTDTAYCNWDVASLDLGNTVAQSIQFGGAIGTGFDNVSVNTVPVPAAGWLMLSGLGATGLLRRRHAK